MAKVVVYSFRCFDIDVGAMVVPPFKATERAIQQLFGGEAFPLSAETVDADEVDDEGRWLRLATGWGQLR